MRTRTEFARDDRSSRERSSSRNVTLVEVLSGIDHMEVNRDCVVGEVVVSLRKSGDGESVRELGLLRVDLFGGEAVTALAATVFGGASKGDGNKREEESESDGKVKDHVERK